MALTNVCVCVCVCVCINTFEWLHTMTHHFTTTHPSD